MLHVELKPRCDAGPFWVCVTLVFCIAIMGNVADYLHSGGEGQHWRYDFRKVSISATTIFCYALLVPLGLWAFLWWRKKQDEKAVLGLTEMVSLYGYSLAIYIPISVLLLFFPSSKSFPFFYPYRGRRSFCAQILWAIPLVWVQWTLLIVGAALSGSVLVLALWPPLSSFQRGVAVVMLGIIVALHFLLAAGLQLYFFRYSTDIMAVPVPSGTGNGAASPAHPQAVEAAGHPLGRGVTELQPLNLVLDGNQEPAFVNALEMPSSSSVRHPPSDAKLQSDVATAIQANATSPPDSETGPVTTNSAGNSHSKETEPVPVEDHTDDAATVETTKKPKVINVTSTKSEKEKPA